MSSRASVAQTEEGPRPFAEALDQPGFRQQPQMARDARLRLAQDGGEVRYGQLRLRQQGEDAQARGLAGGLERAIEGLERQVGNGGHDVGLTLGWTGPTPSGEDIKISLCL